MQVISRLFKQTNKSIGWSECDVPSVLIKLSLVSPTEPLLCPDRPLKCQNISRGSWSSDLSASQANLSLSLRSTMMEIYSLDTLAWLPLDCGEICQRSQIYFNSPLSSL